MAVTDLAAALAEANLSSPMLPENRGDPYPIYRFIREREPVHHAPDGSWILTRYDHSAALLRDPRFSTNPALLTEGPDASAMGPVRQVGSSLMMFLDPPDHTRLRSLVSQAFTPRMVEALRSRIQSLVDELLDAVVETGEMDVLADLAYPLPTVVICELLGVPPEDREKFKGWSADASRLLDGYLDKEAMDRGMVAGMYLFQYFTDLVEARRAEPRNDLLSALLAAETAGDKLTHAELLSTATLLFVAGFETTMNLVGNGTLALLRNPDQLARMRDDPSLVRTGVEELLRYDGPVHVTARIAKEDVRDRRRGRPRGRAGRRHPRRRQPRPGPVPRPRPPRRRPHAQQAPGLRRRPPLLPRRRPGPHGGPDRLRDHAAPAPRPRAGHRAPHVPRPLRDPGPRRATGALQGVACKPCQRPSGRSPSST